MGYKIVLFEDWHKTALLYFTLCLKDHSFYYVRKRKESLNNLEFLPAKFPPNLKIITWKELDNYSFDYKLLMHSGWTLSYRKNLQDPRIKKIDLPIIWRTYWNEGLHPNITRNYPVLFGIYKHSKFPWIKKYSTVLDPPPPDIWKGWKGNKKRVFFSSQRWSIPQWVLIDNKWILKHDSQIARFRLKLLKEFKVKTYPEIPGSTGYEKFSTFFSEMQKSRVYVESTNKPLSFGVLEAMVMGMPVVTFKQKHTDFDSIIRDGKDGFCSDNPDYLIAKINELMENFELAKEFGKKARERIMNLASYDKARKIWEWAFRESKKVWEEWKGR